jgi:hypothetical protein
VSGLIGVISEIRRPKPNAGVASWFEEAAGEDLFVSVLVVGADVPLLNPWAPA